MVGKNEQDVHRPTVESTALGGEFEKTTREVDKADCASVQECPKSSPYKYGCVKVHVRAERLTKTYPSQETLLFGKGKKAFTFSDCDGGGGDFAFGSRVGEYCLLRIRIVASPDDPPLLIDSIVDVQILYQGGGTLYLKTAEAQSRPHEKEVVALLEPAALQRRVTSGSPTDVENAQKRDTRFQLHIQVALAGSQQQVDIAKTVCWRTLSSTKPPIRQRYQAGMKALKRLSRVVENRFHCLSSNVDDSRRMGENVAKQEKEHSPDFPLDSEVTWRACF